MVTDNFLGIPVKNYGKIEPSPAGHLDFSHINTPEVIGSFGMGFRMDWAAFGLKPEVGSDDKILFFHKAIDTFFIHRYALTVFQVRPDPPVAPEGMVGLYFLDLRKQYLVTFYNAL